MMMPYWNQGVAADLPDQSEAAHLHRCGAASSLRISKFVSSTLAFYALINYRGFEKAVANMRRGSAESLLTVEADELTCATSEKTD